MAIMRQNIAALNMNSQFLYLTFVQIFQFDFESHNSLFGPHYMHEEIKPGSSIQSIWHTKPRYFFRRANKKPSAPSHSKDHSSEIPYKKYTWEMCEQTSVSEQGWHGHTGETYPIRARQSCRSAVGTADPWAGLILETEVNKSGEWCGEAWHTCHIAAPP